MLASQTGVGSPTMTKISCIGFQVHSIVLCPAFLNYITTFPLPILILFIQRSHCWIHCSIALQGPSRWSIWWHIFFVNICVNNFLALSCQNMILMWWILYRILQNIASLKISKALKFYSLQLHLRMPAFFSKCLFKKDIGPILFSVLYFRNKNFTFFNIQPHNLQAVISDQVVCWLPSLFIPLL